MSIVMLLLGWLSVMQKNAKTLKKQSSAERDELAQQYVHVPGMHGDAGTPGGPQLMNPRRDVTKKRIGSNPRYVGNRMRY
jgi:hypothetical protein